MTFAVVLCSLLKSFVLSHSASSPNVIFMLEIYVCGNYPYYSIGLPGFFVDSAGSNRASSNVSAFGKFLIAQINVDTLVSTLTRRVCHYRDRLVTLRKKTRIFLWKIHTNFRGGGCWNLRGSQVLYQRATLPFL